MAASIGIGDNPGNLKKYNPMIELVVTKKCHPRKRRPVRYAWRDLNAIVDGHAQYLAVPFDHGIQIGRSQPVVHQLRMNNNLGIHFYQRKLGWDSTGENYLVVARAVSQDYRSKVKNDD